MPEDKTRCPGCEGIDVRHSHRRGILDAVMKAFGKAPRRCRRCARRFYVPDLTLRREMSAMNSEAERAR